MKVFLDTNVLLDVLARRRKFYRDSAAVWTLAEQRQIIGLVSAVNFSNIFYIVRRLEGRDTARDALRLLRDTFEPVACDAAIVRQAIDAEFGDFEDAVQHASAAAAGADCLLTRNPDDFPTSGVPILSPAEFLAAHSFDG